MALEIREEVRRRIMSRAIDLPAYPGVALKLQRVVAGGNFGISDLAKLIEADQALAVTALRTANSALYQSGQPATTLQQAISRIGASELSNLAIAATLGAAASSAGALVSLRREAWRRSLVGAAFARTLAAKRRLDPGEAFLAGLLCDFGQTVAYGSFESILGAGAPSRPAAEWQQEAEALHVELGIVLAEMWKLPEQVSEVVMRHHGADVTACSHPELVRLVATTSELALRVLEAGGSSPETLEVVEGLTNPERIALSALIPVLPSHIQAFEGATPESAPVTSAVKQEETTLSPPVWALDISVEIQKRGKAEGYRTTGISHRGLRLSGAAPQAEGYLVTLQLPSMSLCASVKRCATAGAGNIVEVHPFAMDRPTQAKWTALVRSAEAAAGGPAGTG